MVMLTLNQLPSLYSAEQGTPNIRLYDGRGDGTATATITNVHKRPCHLMVVSVYSLIFLILFVKSNLQN